MTALLLAIAPAIAVSQPASPGVPCAACVILVANAGQALLAGEPLNGVEVLFRLAPGDESAPFRAAAETVRAASGRPGVWLPLAGALPAAEVLVASYRIIVDASGEPVTPDMVYRLKSRLTDVRGTNPDALIGIFVADDAVGSLAGQDLGAYVDFVATAAPPPPSWPQPGVTAVGVLYPAAWLSGGATTPERWLGALPADALDARRVLAELGTAAAFFTDALVAGGTADVRCGGSPLATWLDPETLDTIAMARGCPSSQLVVSPATPAPRVATLSGDVVLVRVPGGEGRFAEGVQVRAARALTVREIVARHQAAAARQRRAVRRLISTGTMTLTFEAPGFPAPIAITSEAVIFSDPERIEIEQRDVRVNGIAFRGGVPRLPLLEPERVASPPLAITLGDLYRYALAGRDRVEGLECYVVQFEPIDRARALFAGRAWIAVDSFAMVKVAAVQTGLRGPIVSSEQTDEFRRERDGVWLLARSEVRQIYEGAGHRTPIHRVLAMRAHEVNPGTFEARRAAAYASPSIMLRDTPEGFRYLRRAEGEPGGAARTAAPEVAGRADRVRTLALGVIIDPNISRPLPFAGLSYVDFNLFGTGAQLNGFFGGTYGQLAFSAPSIRGSRWQVAGRAFGIASSYNDRAFVGGREIYAANISQRPAHASVAVLRPLTARLTARLGYEFDYTHFARSDSTAPAFVVPASQTAHTMRVALEGQKAGWTASAWWAGSRRQGWRPWGDPATAPTPYTSDDRDYQRAGVVLARSIVLSPRLVGRVEGAWMSGRDLDRFSRYTFGGFDNRLRGYPSALIRYDRGAVARTTAAWAASRLIRLDGFFDTAYVRDPGFGPRSRGYHGVGAAIEAPAPFGTLVAVEWGYGFQGIDSNGRQGTQVVRISGYKMF